MESHQDRPGADEAREALESIDDVRRRTAHSAASPRGYYALVGVGEGLMIAALGGGHSIRHAALALGLGLIFAGMVWYTRSTGTMTWARIWEPWAWLAWVMVGVAIVAVVVAVTVGQPWAIVSGLATAVVWAILGPIFDRRWVHSIEEQP